MSRNERNKVKKYREKFGYNIPNNYREALISDKKNGNTLWSDAISKQLKALERLDVLQLYPPKTKFKNKDGWKYAPIHIIFYVKQQALRHNIRLFLSENVVDFTQHTTYSSTTKDVSVILIILIAVKNELGLMAEDIGNALCMALCTENIWSCCGVEFGTRFGALVVINQYLHGLKTASKSFQKYFGYFLGDLGFTPSRADQELQICKNDKYKKYEYIATYVDDVIIATKNPSKYMHAIEMHFKVEYIMESPNYYLGNEIVQVGYRIHVSSKKYLNEIMRKYHNIHGDLKKEVLPMRVKEHPELDDYPFLNYKEHKYFQQIIGVCQWLIFPGIFDLAYYVSSLSRLLDATQVGHTDLARIIFGYFKNHPKKGYAINPQTLTIDANYQKVHIK